MSSFLASTTTARTSAAIASASASFWNLPAASGGRGGARTRRARGTQQAPHVTTEAQSRRQHRRAAGHRAQHTHARRRTLPRQPRAHRAPLRPAPPPAYLLILWLLLGEVLLFYYTGSMNTPFVKCHGRSSSCTMPSMRILGAARLWGARRAAGTAGTVARAAASPLTGATGRRGFAEGAACPIAYRCVPCAGTQACGAAARKSATLTHRHPCLRARGPPPRRYQASALAAAQQAGRDLQARVLGRRACACAVLRCVRPGR